MPAKGQEMEDHYFGAIHEKVAAFMRELNDELWAMGVTAKTQHNEVAPNQFELACVFSSSNVAADSNQLVMETMQQGRRPPRHGRPPAREALQRHQRLGQARQLVHGHRHGHQPPRARARTPPPTRASSSSSAR